MAPARPARSPDLDLRLNPSAQQQLLQQNPPSSFQDTLRSPTAGSSQYRDSYLSGNSGAPSYLSGSTDYIHLDAPKIVTSRQIQIGQMQQAEVVQFGRPPAQNNMENLNQSTSGAPNAQPRPLSPSTPTSHKSNPFGGGSSDDNHLQPPAPLSPATFGSRTLGSEVSGAASASSASYRTLTPVPSYRTNGAEEDLRTEDEPPTSGDLRFSMGSFARDSVSTMGTGRYLAQATPIHLAQAGEGQGLYGYGVRESMASDRSGVDSVLHGFPMIPPNQQQHQTQNQQRSPIPQSTSISTLEHAAMPSRPPTTYRHNPPPPNTNTGGTPNRNTQASVGLGNFPFVTPPPPKGLNEREAPTAGAAAGARITDGPPTLPHPTKGRNTMGMSTTSEGLGGFEFSFDGHPPAMPDSRQ